MREFVDQKYTCSLEEAIEAGRKLMAEKVETGSMPRPSSKRRLGLRWNGIHTISIMERRQAKDSPRRAGACFKRTKDFAQGNCLYLSP